MPGKRKRDLLDYDINKSDSEDENFEPENDRPPRSKKKSRPGKSSRPVRRRGKYRGSDIEDDEEISESEQEDSFNEDEDEDEDEEEAPINTTTGRRMRKVTVKQTNYKESSEDEDEFRATSEDGKDELGTTPRKPARASKIIRLKVPPESLRKARNTSAALGMRRSTRARTAEIEDDDNDTELVELSNSGRHARPARGSQSKSPEAFSRGRATRGTKGLKKTIQPAIEEASQEDSPAKREPANPEDPDDEDIPNSQVDEAEAETAPEDPANGKDEPMDTVEATEEPDEDDDVLITRRTRGRATIVEAEADAEADADADADADVDAGPEDETEIKNAGSRRRLTRKSRANKSLQEPSSDFEPGNDSEEDRESGAGDNENDGDSSSSGRGRKSSRGKAVRSRRQSGSGDEENFDPGEIEEELEDLREDSISRSRETRRKRARASSPQIIFEEKRRRRTKEVNYAIPPLNQANFEVEDEGEAEVSTPARRRGRAAASAYTTRSLLTVAGPFGGVSGEGAIFTGPWGTGSAAAAGNVDSDSSDDEMGARSGFHGHSAPRQSLTGLASNPDGVGKGPGATAPNVGKIRDHKALADADPLGVDLNVDFSQVGGMEGHIDQLKEMVQLPLLYPELFQRLHVTPPRGVLFHGPPGTGKTLLARALANSVGIGGRKITFYMRKGADALSKWVGEAEKQLRLLFEEARKTQPSIIFFDEIDGLAPVRSSKQEQIHASIVSTLLALMDGMDGRGQVIVIGATNRPDNIDPALRRPGRFDREFYFPLPDIDARKAIINIHTKDWGLSDDFKQTLARDAKGFGGADLRALCTEAALNAIQRTYPQIYSSKDKLVVDPEKIIVHMTDFILAKRNIIPSSERSSTSGASPLPKTVEPLLRNQFRSIKTRLDNALPRKKKVTALEEAMFEPYEDDDMGLGRQGLFEELNNSRVFRPRLLICGSQGMGQSYISSALLHYFEGVHVQNFDLPTILGDVRPAEQMLVELFKEVKRHKPSVIFVPNIDAWYATLAGPPLTAFLAMLRSIQPTDPIILVGTAETELKNVDPDLKRDLFGFSFQNTIEISHPAKDNREEYFTRIIDHIRRLPKDFPDPMSRKKRRLEELPTAPPPPPKVSTKEEINAERVRYRQLLNQMKVHLQPIMDQIARKYRNFRQPVIPESHFQYLLDEADSNFVRPDVSNAPPRPYEIAKDADGTQVLRQTETGKIFYNLDVNTIETRLANGYYIRPSDFVKDVWALKHDAENIGDRPRWLKASELLANVEVDVTDIAEKFKAQGIDWDYLYQQDQQRNKEREDRLRKRKAMKSVIDRVHSNASNGEVFGQNGEHSAAPQTTTAQFQFIGHTANGNDEASLSSHATTNGATVPSRVAGDDVPMRDIADVDMISPMQPPSQWPYMPPTSLTTSVMATTGGTAQISQVSGVQALPPGVSPSALLNEASTTKTSDPSHRSSNLSTQMTNGVFHDHSGSTGELPDTQPLPDASQTTSSEWAHSQAHGQAQGLLRGYSHQPSYSHESQSQSSPSGPKSSHAPSMADILNDPSDEPSQSQRLSQLVELDEGSAQFFLEELTKRSSGFTVEQLEQVNRELIAEIWHTRGEYNRMRVLHSVTRVFNEAIADIEVLQRVVQPSQ
ncbi:hypothetical protein F5Y15DRAFT_422998 [Xylariaceae sp. FL0016]|nr:hypothetical protein F5Y15DRAFT_422998 [Xylariaceae sp. FL0016]